MNEHEPAPAAEPRHQHPESNAKQDHRDCDRHNPVEMAHHVFSGLIYFPADISGIPPGTEIKVPMKSGFTEMRQPRAKTDHEPFAEVERLKEQALNSLDGKSKRKGNAWLGCHRQAPLANRTSRRYSADQNMQRRFSGRAITV